MIAGKSGTGSSLCFQGCCSIITEKNTNKKQTKQKQIKAAEVYSQPALKEKQHSAGAGGSGLLLVASENHIRQHFACQSIMIQMIQFKNENMDLPLN